VRPRAVPNRVPSARARALSALPRSRQRSLASRIDALANPPFPPHQVTKIEGEEHLYRLRVGDFGVLFTLTGDPVTIVKIGPRRDPYRNL